MFHLKVATRNVKARRRRKYVLTFGLMSSALLLIFGNIKNESYYLNHKAAEKEILQIDSEAQSIQFYQSFNEKPINCTIKMCIVTCIGDMKDLKKYLEIQKTCSSNYLSISDGIFPEDKLQTNWLEGSCYLDSIKISLSKLSEIQDGAFNQNSVAYLAELELNNVQLTNLTEKTFVGLKAIKTFTLVNRIEYFSGEAFLKPMMKTLKKLVIKHETSIATDPGPWLRGESFPKLVTIVFDGSNFGGYINKATFEHLNKLSILMMNSCKITSIADGSFDFMKIQMVLLISLQNNLLKRLDGDYLSTITSLRRLDIQNNPWDCTCELEHLARVLKKYPAGFGDNSKCYTPPHLAGKFLHEIDLERCETTPSTELISVSSTASTELEYTSPSSQKQTTALSADLFFVECGTLNLQFTNNYPPNVLELAWPDGDFKIVPISETSVRMIFEGVNDDLGVIWFHEELNLNETNENFRVVEEFNIGCQSELENTVVVEGLVENQSYIFCIIKNGSKVISPFNCQSLFTTVRTVNINDEIWLMKKDVPLVICVFVASIVVSILVGLIGMFILSQYHPSLLGVNKHVNVGCTKFGENQRNIKSSITETSFENSFRSEESTGHLRRFSTESGLSYMMANNYEILGYSKRMNVNNDLILSNRVPRSPASPLPPLPKRGNKVLNKKLKDLYKRKNDNIMELSGNEDAYTSVV